MKNLFTSLFLLISLNVSADDQVSNELGFSETEITMAMIAEKIPSFRNLWTKKVVMDAEIDIFKQDNLFLIDDAQYRQLDFNKIQLKSGNYSIYDSKTALQSEGFLSNKIRLMAGMPPISIHDNRPVMLCKLEDHVTDTYYELSVTQYNTIRVAFPSNYDMDYLCTTTGLTRQYWKARFNDFYDQYGNKK